MKKIKSEKGQVMVEFSLVLPLFLLLLFAIIEISYISYHQVLFDHTMRSATWRVREARIENSVMAGAHYGNEYIYEGEGARSLIMKSIGETNDSVFGKLDMNQLTIDRPRIIFYLDDNKEYKYQKPARLDYLTYDEAKPTKVEYKILLVKIQGDANYRIPSVTPFTKLIFKDGLVLKKDLNKIKITKINSINGA